MPYSYLRDRSINDVFFRSVANYTYDWESWHDPNGKLVWVNNAVERLTGYSTAQCMEMDDYPLPIVSKNDRVRIQKMLDDAISLKSYNDLEFEIVTREGLTRWMAVSWQPMYDDDGKHLGFRTSVRDITDRQSLKEQLRLYTPTKTPAESGSFAGVLAPFFRSLGKSAWARCVAGEFSRLSLLAVASERGRCDTLSRRSLRTLCL